jgi:hypothetical protein
VAKKNQKNCIFGLHFASRACILTLLRELGGKEDFFQKIFIFSLTGALKKVKSLLGS